MILENLWDNLAPRSATLSQLKKDYERGIAPELPYFIVGQDRAKYNLLNIYITLYSKSQDISLTLNCR